MANKAYSEKKLTLSRDLGQEDSYIGVSLGTHSCGIYLGPLTGAEFRELHHPGRADP